MPTCTTMAPRVAFVTLGCAKNEVDTAHMKARLASAGFELVDDASCADAVVVNTCSFIQAATEESIEAVLDAAELPNIAEGAALIVAGCMPSRYGDELADELTEARAFVPCNREDDIVSILAQVLNFEVDAPNTDDGAESRAAKDSCMQVPYSAIAEATAKTGASPSVYVKISDGCDRFCSYCTIPFIRGRYYSYTYNQIRSEVYAHVTRGVREIVLIAQDTGRWGADFDNPSSLAVLVGMLAEEFPSTWFRLMYIQPEGITDELLDAVAAHNNVCDYLDIPMQHVDPDILHAMHRHGSRVEFKELIERVRARIPQITLRTTVIVGFPGESDQQFEELCSFIEEGYFDYVGIFPYSREEGTRAYKLPGQIDEEEKIYRASHLRDIADALSSARISARIGQEMDVLVEGVEEDGQLFGRAMCQAPEVDGVVYLNSGTIGEVKRVTIQDTLLYEMEGE